MGQQHDTQKKDSYNIIFEMVGGRKNRYNSPSYGKPNSPQGETNGHNNYYVTNDDDDCGNHSGQSLQTPQQQGVIHQPAPPSGGAYAYAYSTPYQHQYPPPPPPNPNHLAVGGGYHHGDYHVPAGYYCYPGSYVPHQGGYGIHGGGGERFRKNAGLVGAAVGVASVGGFKLLRERIWAGRRRHGRRY